MGGRLISTLRVPLDPNSDAARVDTQAQPRLEVLSMPNTDTFTAAVLPLIAARALCLTELYCPYCVALHEGALPALLQFVEECPTLRKLTVSWENDIEAMEEGEDEQADALRAAVDDIELLLELRGGELVIQDIMAA